MPAVPHGLVGKKLSHAMLDAARRITGDGLGAIPLGLDLDRRFRARAVAIEFLKPILLDLTFDAPGANGETSLAKLLGDDVSRGIRIEKALANDLPLNFIGTDVVGFGTTLLVLESRGARFPQLEHLVIAACLVTPCLRERPRRP